MPPTHVDHPPSLLEPLVPLESSPPWIRTVGWVGLFVSLVAVVAGGLWSTMADPEDVWTEQQAREFQQASDALHQAMTAEPSTRRQPAAGEGGMTPREAAEARFEAIRAELEAAQFAKDQAGLLVMQIGLGGAGCCMALLFLSRRT